MTRWLEKLVLALGLDTSIEPEQCAAFVVAADLAAKHRVSLGIAYLRIERSMPDTFKYLEAKRTVAGVASFVAENDECLESWHTSGWNSDRAGYPGNRRALEAMLSCTIRPLSCRGRVP